MWKQITQRHPGYFQRLNARMWWWRRQCWRGHQRVGERTVHWDAEISSSPLFFCKCHGGVRRYEVDERAGRRHSEGMETQQRRENKPLLHNLSSTAKVSSPQACTTNLTALALKGGMSVLFMHMCGLCVVCVCLVRSWYDIMSVDSLALSESLRVSDMCVVFGAETQGSWL